MCHLSFNHLWLVGRFLSPRPLQPLFDTSLVRSLETIDHTVSAVVGRTPLLHRDGCSDSTQCDLHSLIYSQFALCNMSCENTFVIYCIYLYVMYWLRLIKNYCIVLYCIVRSNKLNAKIFMLSGLVFMILLIISFLVRVYMLILCKHAQLYGQSSVL